MNSLLQIIEPKAYHHAVAAEAERYESVPLDEPSPEELYWTGFSDGFGNRRPDKNFGWSLDYSAGYSNGFCDLFLAKPEMHMPVNLNHSEYDEF